MARPLTVFRFSEGLRFASMVGTAGGICVAGYGVYTFAYYKYLQTAATKSSKGS